MVKRKQLRPNGSADFLKALARVRQSKEGLYLGFARMRLEGAPDTLRKTSAEFARHPGYRRFTLKAPFPKRPQELAPTSFRYVGSFDRELAWISGLLAEHASNLTRFAALRDQFERAYLQGDYGSAGDVLDRVETAFGFSIWLIQRRMDVLAQTSTSAARSRYLADVLGEGSSGVIQFLMAWFSYRTAAAVSRSEYERFLKESGPLRRGIHLILHADAGVYPELNAADAATMLGWTDVLPIVDRYQFALVTIAQFIGSSASGAADFEAINRYFSPLREQISDPLLNRIAFAAGYSAPAAGPNMVLLDLVDRYVRGEYAQIIDSFRLADYADCLVEAIAIALRCHICTGIETIPFETWGIDQKSIVGRIAGDLAEVLRFGSNGIDAKLRLNKLILVHAPHSWSASLSLVLERQRHDERVGPPSREQRIGALRSTAEHPILAFCFNDEALTSKYLEAAAAAAPGSPTVRSLSSLLNLQEPEEIAGLPTDRSRHVNGLRLLRQGSHVAAAAMLEELAADTGSALLRHEASLLLVACHLQGKEVAGAAELTARLFMEERYFGIVLPVAPLIAALLVEHDRPLSSSPTRGKISVAIAFDIYSRFIAADRDAERADAFNDVLRKNGVQRASALPEIIPPDQRDQLIYFLRYICIPEVLDQSLILDDSRSVEDERLAVLVALSDLEDPSADDLDAFKNEIREIRTRQVVRDTALKLDQSKIYVNVDGIRRVLDVEMRENWNRYKFMVDNGGDFDFADTDKLVISSLDSGQNVLMVRVNSSQSERLNLFKRIVAEVRDQFALNKEHGLNSNLSANIRHGYVLRELRAPLVNRNLVTNLISAERGYHPNTYWSERLEESDLCNGEIVETFQLELSEFSKRIDGMIERLNRISLRIRSDANPHGLFNYTLSETALVILDQQWGPIDSYDEFMDSIFDAMWTATEHNLKNVRSELSRTALRYFIEAIDELSAKLESLGIFEIAPSISDAITMAKTDMRAAVDRVASWFTLSGNHEYADFDLEIPLRAGLASVKAYYGDLDIKHTYTATPTTIMLLGWGMPGFGRLFFQLLDNAANHGGRGRGNLQIDVTAELVGSSLLVRVENDLPGDADLEALAKRVAELNAEYGQAKAMDLIGEEGGSGYSKIWKIIRADLKRDHDISVTLKDDKFVVEILMNAGGIVCRPS